VFKYKHVIFHVFYFLMFYHFCASHMTILVFCRLFWTFDVASLVCGCSGLDLLCSLFQLQRPSENVVNKPLQFYCYKHFMRLASALPNQQHHSIEGKQSRLAISSKHSSYVASKQSRTQRLILCLSSVDMSTLHTASPLHWLHAPQ